MSCMFVPNSEAISHVTLVFGAENLPKGLAQKTRLIQKRLKYGKKYFTRLYVLRYSFIPTNPLLAAKRFFLFFFFFFLNLVRSSFPKPQNIEIEFLWKVVELQTRFCLQKIFWKTPPRTPKMGAKKSIFWTVQARAPFSFDIIRQVANKYFDTVWGYCTPPRPPKWIPQKWLFWTPQPRVPVVYDISGYSSVDIQYQWIVNRQMFWHSLGVPTPRRSPKWTPKHQLFERLKLGR